MYGMSHYIDTISNSNVKDINFKANYINLDGDLSLSICVL